ncbi:cupin domain-containing protein [Veronia pacifica]|uniref:Anti-sigma factor n=1 Tax=Veronia pacifica TaxID=1080227 RepID=A0A1C3EM67_9GAMM|nr:cupin domain-containing protein [Veronia pacifica]ODA34343.1 anti-sigma factor [Veronia pacifica]
MATAQKTAAQKFIETNVDFDKTVKIHGGETPFSPTPMKGVERMMFERRGDEVAIRATSVVRYAPESYFEPHAHPGGEEFIVLEGTFQDNHGNYPKGYYVRNPVCSTHRPFSDDGCEIFVKLAQLPPEEGKEQFIIDMNTAEWKKDSNKSCKLHLWESDYEHTDAFMFDAGYESETQLFNDVAEFFVIKGEVTVNGVSYPERSWLRFAEGTPVTISSENGATVYRKIGKGYARKSL